MQQQLLKTSGKVETVTQATNSKGQDYLKIGIKHNPSDEMPKAYNANLNEVPEVRTLKPGVNVSIEYAEVSWNRGGMQQVSKWIKKLTPLQEITPEGKSDMLAEIQSLREDMREMANELNEKIQKLEDYITNTDYTELLDEIRSSVRVLRAQTNLVGEKVGVTQEDFKKASDIE